MALRINTNISAFDTHRNLQMTDEAMSKSLQKLSSGLRINTASDDAAGLQIATNMLSQVNGLSQAQANAQDGISLINTADGALGEVQDIMQRMRELAVQSANGTLTAADHTATNNEYQALLSEIDNISNNTSFNGFVLLNAATTFTFQVGANNGQSIALTTQTITQTALTIDKSDTSLQTDAMNAIASLDAAISAVSKARSALGAVSNRLSDEINNLAISQENISSARSRIMDVDMASEMTNLSREQILTQSGTAMLAQANAAPQSVLSLLK